jgi:hypothetical protein
VRQPRISAALSLVMLLGAALVTAHSSHRRPAGNYSVGTVAVEAKLSLGHIRIPHSNNVQLRGTTNYTNCDVVQVSLSTPVGRVEVPQDCDTYPAAHHTFTAGYGVDAGRPFLVLLPHRLSYGMALVRALLLWTLAVLLVLAVRGCTSHARRGNTPTSD